MAPAAAADRGLGVNIHGPAATPWIGRAATVPRGADGAVCGPNVHRLRGPPPRGSHRNPKSAPLSESPRQAQAAAQPGGPGSGQPCLRLGPSSLSIRGPTGRQYREQQAPSRKLPETSPSPLLRPPRARRNLVRTGRNVPCGPRPPLEHLVAARDRGALRGPRQSRRSRRARLAHPPRPPSSSAGRPPVTNRPAPPSLEARRGSRRRQPGPAAATRPEAAGRREPSRGLVLGQPAQSTVLGVRPRRNRWARAQTPRTTGAPESAAGARTLARITRGPRQSGEGDLESGRGHRASWPWSGASLTAGRRAVRGAGHQTAKVGDSGGLGIRAWADPGLAGPRPEARHSCRARRNPGPRARATGPAAATISRLPRRIVHFVRKRTGRRESHAYVRSCFARRATPPGVVVGSQACGPGGAGRIRKAARRVALGATRPGGRRRPGPRPRGAPAPSSGEGAGIRRGPTG